MAAFEAATKKGSTTPEEAYAIFDALQNIPVEFMLGTWKGSGFRTGHLMDGRLEAFNCYGKSFNGIDQVDSLVLYAKDGGIFAWECRSQDSGHLREGGNTSASCTLTDYGHSW